MTAPKSVDNSSIYSLVDRTRLELKSDIIRLESKFDTLEAGRLTRAEYDIGRLQVKEATLNTKVVALVFIISTTTSAIIYMLVSRFIK